MSSFLMAASAAAGQHERARVGLVLAGGGAKGAAHVGVIKVLDELGIRVDAVAGTSMGAIVGGLYASGLSGRELEQAVLSIDWEDIFDDDPPRAERSLRRKDDDSEVLIRYRLGLKDGSLRLPSGIIIGQKLGLALRRLAARYPGEVDFDQLPRQFRAVAADLIEGEPVVIGSGSLARAMHASMSVPGVFPPVEYEGRLLVDGGLVNNVPIDVARSMGVERLIVVTLLSEPVARDDVYDAVKVAELSINLMIARETKRQLASLMPDDIVINPELGDLGSGDFPRSHEAVMLGEAAARRHLDVLSALAAEQDAAGGGSGHTRPGADPEAGSRRSASAGSAARAIVAALRIENDTPLDDAVLASKLTVRPGDALDLAQLEQDISNIYGLGYFETVDYRLEQGAEGTEVVIVATERGIGLNTLRFGLTLESDLDGDSAFNFVTEYSRLGVNALGGELRSALAFGENVLVAGEFFQPLDFAQRWFVDVGARYSEVDRGAFDGNRRTAEFRVESAVATLQLGRAFTTCCEIRAGLRFGVGDARVKTGAQGLSGGDFDIGSLTAGIGYDTLDDTRFPRDGEAFGIDYEKGLQALGSSEPLEQLRVAALVARSFGDNTVLAGVNVGADLSDPSDGAENVQSLFGLGGLFNLSGLARDQLSGQNSVLGNLIYYRRLTRLAGIDVPVPLYAGASLEYGGVYDDLDDFGSGGDFIANALFLGADTALGPLYAAFGQTEGGNRSLYLFLGRSF